MPHVIMTITPTKDTFCHCFCNIIIVHFHFLSFAGSLALEVAIPEEFNGTASENQGTYFSSFSYDNNNIR